MTQEQMLPPLPVLYAWSDRDEREKSFGHYMDLVKDYEAQVTKHTESAFGGWEELPPRQKLAIFMANEPVLEWVTRPAIDGPNTPAARQAVAQQILLTMGITDPSLLTPEQMQQIGQMVEQSPEVIATRLSMLQLDGRATADLLAEYGRLQKEYGRRA